MKFSYNNYPILQKLHEGKLGNVPVFELDSNFLLHPKFHLFPNYFKEFSPKFRDNINVISTPFWNAANKAKNKLADLFSDVINNDTSDLKVDGTYILDKYVYMLHYDIKKGSQSNDTIFYVFTKEAQPMLFYLDRTDYNEFEFMWVSSSLLNQINELPGKDKNERLRLFVYSRFLKIQVLNMFKKYAAVETKILPPNSKIKVDNEKHINDTRLNLTYLDSKWFTTLVQSNAFNVRGHFRLQACGKNWSERQLTWIDEFHKNGYTAPAKKISQTTNN